MQYLVVGDIILEMVFYLFQTWFLYTHLLRKMMAKKFLVKNTVVIKYS